MAHRSIRSVAAVATIAGIVLGGCSSNPSENAGEPVASEDQALYGLGSIGGKWPSGKVPVCYQNTSDHPELQALIPNILATSWSRYANLTFTGFGACANGANQVQLGFSTTPGFRGVTDNLGYGQRTISLISDDTSANRAHFVYEVIHEMGHALGFAHEMKRPDNWVNGSALQCSPPASDIGNYAVEPGGLYLTATYDSASIMNYCDPSGNQTTQLSAGDIEGVSRSDAYGLPCLVASPLILTLTQGQTDVPLLVSPNMGSWPDSSAAVNVYLSGLPSGVSTTTGGDAYGFHQYLSASSTAPVGQYVITVNGLQGAGASAAVYTQVVTLNVNAAPPPPPPPGAPGCTLASTCDGQYIPPSNGVAGHTITAETVTGSCATVPNTMQELVGGQWVAVSAFNGNLGYTTTEPDKFQVGSQSTTGQTTAGAAVGSVLTLRACTQNAGGTTCDNASAVTVESCCSPISCDATMCGVHADGCGGTINCGTTCTTCATQKCPVGQKWDSTSCSCEIQCRGAAQCCAAAGGTWNGKTCS